MADTGIDIAPLHPLFAAEVTGLDLATGLPDAAAIERLRAALAQHSVLVFPGQCLDDARQIDFSELFGPLETTKVGTNGAGSKLVVLSNLGPDGTTVPPTDRQMLNNKANQIWHADSSFKPVPARASMLSAREIPEHGGNTEFISMRAVWAELPERLKRAVEGRVAVHDYAHSRARIDPELVTEEERRAVPPVRQAMVLDHGLHGRSLYIGAHAARIEGMAEAESRALLHELTDFATQERFVYSHRWRPFDLLLWDNRAVMHRAQPFSGLAARRHLVRTTIAGEGPTL